MDIGSTALDTRQRGRDVRRGQSHIEIVGVRFARPENLRKPADAVRRTTRKSPYVRYDVEELHSSAPERISARADAAQELVWGQRRTHLRSKGIIS
jgi:hypothetical protein